jgi:(4S)-4-hydroxy-5-phosphonooxypentane-2,3-dione isomerase
MFVVVVEFDINHEHVSSFLPLILENAKVSSRCEPGCRQFDVCTDPTRPDSVFLYEVYDDRGAFDAHKASEHFKRFDSAVRAMVERKTVRTFERLEPT